MKSQKLFCIPYAGGSAAMIYTIWRKYLDSHILLIPVEYPGHGKRIREALNKNIEELAKDIFTTIIEPETKSHPDYMIYGHSMGTIVVYELLKLIKEKNYTLPHTIFLSGRYSPHLPYPPERVHLLLDNQLIDKLIELGGTPANIYDYPELINAQIPIIRNDYALLDKYNFTMPINSFNTNLIFIYSDNDPYLTDREKVDEWRHYTNESLSIVETTGNHFFINEKTVFICNIINKAANLR